MAAALVFLKSRLGEWAIILVLITGIGVYAHGRIVDHAKAEQLQADQKVKDKLKDQLTAAQKSLADYRAQYQKFVADTAKAEAEQAAQQRLSDQQAKAALDTAQARITRLQKTLNQQQVKSYVSAQADAHCTIPAGFVQLFNGSAEASAGAGLPGYAKGTAGAADAASGIDLSAVAVAAARNNAQAVYWRSQVIAWQTWYATSYKTFEAARQQQLQAAPTQ